MPHRILAVCATLLFTQVPEYGIRCMIRPLNCLQGILNLRTHQLLEMVDFTIRQLVKAPNDQRNAPLPQPKWCRSADNVVWRGSRGYGRRQPRRTDSVFECVVFLPVCAPLAHGSHHNPCRRHCLEQSIFANGHAVSHLLSILPQHIYLKYWLNVDRMGCSKH